MKARTDGRAANAPRRVSRASSTPPILFCDIACPFAHRVLALVEHLGLVIDRRAAWPGEPIPGLEEHSAAHTVPLLVHAGLTLSESRVIIDYLAARARWEAAYPHLLGPRTAQHHAMSVVDGLWAPVMVGRLGAASAARIRESVAQVAAGLATAPPAPGLMALHLAPVWVHLQWWRPDHTLTQAIRANGAVRGWLDAAAALPCVAATTPTNDQREESLRRVRAMGRSV